MAPAELVALHTSQPWTLRYVASPHGAPFLEGPRFPAPIRRLQTPRVHSPIGSVSVSGQHTTIYTTPSPGGWPNPGRTRSSSSDTTKTRPFPTGPGTSCASSR